MHRGGGGDWQQRQTRKVMTQVLKALSKRICLTMTTILVIALVFCTAINRVLSQMSSHFSAVVCVYRNTSLP